MPLDPCSHGKFEIFEVKRSNTMRYGDIWDYEPNWLSMPWARPNRNFEFL